MSQLKESTFKPSTEALREHALYSTGKPTKILSPFWQATCSRVTSSSSSRLTGRLSRARSLFGLGTLDGSDTRGQIQGCRIVPDLRGVPIASRYRLLTALGTCHLTRTPTPSPSVRSSARVLDCCLSVVSGRAASAPKFYLSSMVRVRCFLA